MPKRFWEKAVRSPRNQGNVTLIHPMSYKFQIPIDEVSQSLVDKYVITNQNVCSEGMVRPRLVKLSYCKFLGATERYVKLKPFTTLKMFFNNYCYSKNKFKNTETYKYF